MLVTRLNFVSLKMRAYFAGDNKAGGYTWQCGCAILRAISPQHRRIQTSAMRRPFYPFYQANFCAECGNRIEARVRFRPRYFCDDCAARLNQRKLMTPLAGVLLVVSLAVFAFSSKRGHVPVQQLSPASNAPSVSAQDSIVNRIPQAQAQSLAAQNLAAQSL